MINNPPQANFTITPQKPVVGDQVKFDASISDDAEDGKNLVYHWEINNNSAIFSVVSPPKQGYDEKGMYWINLTVTDKNGAKGHKNVFLKINQPPIPRIALDGTNLSLGKIINFSADTSEDLDGKIVSYAWDFGDNSDVNYNKNALHSYIEGGKKTVKLSVKDNDGAISNISQEIYINWPPTAKFSLDPQEPNKGDPVSFDASASSDPDGKIKRYLWDFGVGRAEPEVYYSEFAEHTYNRLKKYKITLTVEDDKGATGSFSQLVEVKEINSGLAADKMSPQANGTATEASQPSTEIKLATASSDSTARIWDVQSGQELHTLHHESSVWSVAFSPDGQKVATASFDNTSRIWDAQSGQELHKLPHEGAVTLVVFSPDGQKVATASSDSTARIWDVQSGQELHTLHQESLVWSVAFSPDGQKVATASLFGSTSRIWDVQSGQELHKLTHELWVWSVTFSPDGQRVATASSDSTARIWDVQSGQELHKLLHESSVWSVAFSPDGQKVATASFDNTSRIWDAQSGQELHKLPHEDAVTLVVFSPDGQKVATVSHDNIARIWDVQSGRELHKLHHEGSVRSVAFSPDGQKIATGSDDNIARIWDVQSGQELHKLHHEGSVRSVAFSPITF